jgi:hypothetical protein
MGMQDAQTEKSPSQKIDLDDPGTGCVQWLDEMLDVAL